MSAERRWVVLGPKSIKGGMVWADTWYRARELGMAMFACGPGEITVREYVDPLTKLIPAAAKMRDPITVRAKR